MEGFFRSEDREIKGKESHLASKLASSLRPDNLLSGLLPELLIDRNCPKM